MIRSTSFGAGSLAGATLSIMAGLAGCAFSRQPITGLAVEEGSTPVRFPEDDETPAASAPPAAGDGVGAGAPPDSRPRIDVHWIPLPR